MKSQTWNLQIMSNCRIFPKTTRSGVSLFCRLKIEVIRKYQSTLGLEPSLWWCCLSKSISSGLLRSKFHTLKGTHLEYGSVDLGKYIYHHHKRDRGYSVTTEGGLSLPPSQSTLWPPPAGPCHHWSVFCDYTLDLSFLGTHINGTIQNTLSFLAPFPQHNILLHVAVVHSLLFSTSLHGFAPQFIYSPA